MHLLQSTGHYCEYLFTCGRLQEEAAFVWPILYANRENVLPETCLMVRADFLIRVERGEPTADVTSLDGAHNPSVRHN